MGRKCGRWVGKVMLRRWITVREVLDRVMSFCSFMSFSYSTNEAVDRRAK